MKRVLEEAWHRLRPLPRGWGFWLPVLAVAYLLVLLFLRPVSPFEWDEIQYQRALDRYDVAAHSPHPPGAPLFVASGAILRVLLGDPQWAMQVAAMLLSCIGLIALYRFARHLGGSRWSGVAAAAVCGFAPCFMFHANVGLTDAPAAGMLLAAGLFGALALDRPRLLPVAGVAAALASGIRPQAAPVLVPLGVALLFAAIIRRWWRPLVFGTAAFAITFAAVWLPAILITGVANYRQAVVHHTQYLATAERITHFPTVEFGEVLGFWLVGPLGNTTLAYSFWLLAVTGLLAWWRAGKRLLASLVAAGAVLYVVQGFYTLNVFATGRFFLPALPWLALLVAGNLVWQRSWQRRLAGAVIAAWCVGGVGWGARTYLQRLEPAPVWSALTYVRDHFDPATTRVLFDGAYSPHVDYVLSRAGFRVEALAPEDALAKGDRTERDVVLVRHLPIPGRPVLFHLRWQASKMLQLAFDRYDEATVMGVGEKGPWYSMDWQVRENGRWLVWQSGSIRLTTGEAPLSAVLCPVNKVVEVQQGTKLPWAVEPGECRGVVLLPGQHGRVRVRSSAGSHVLLKPVVFTPLPVGAGAAALREQEEASAMLPGELAYVVPVVAHKAGSRGSFWVTEGSISASGTSGGDLVTAFLPSGFDNAVARFVRLPFEGRRSLSSKDALASLGFLAPGQETSGALLLLWEGRGREALPVVRFRTFDRTRPEPTGEESIVPVLKPSQGLRPGGTARFPEVFVAAGSRVSVGAVGLANVPTEVTFEAGGKSSVAIHVPVFGHAQRPLSFVAGLLDLRATVRGAEKDALVFPYLSLVDGATGHASYLVGAPESPASGTLLLPVGVERRQER
jgi:hypothetical protein